MSWHIDVLASEVWLKLELVLICKQKNMIWNLRNIDVFYCGLTPDVLGGSD